MISLKFILSTSFTYIDNFIEVIPHKLSFTHIDDFIEIYIIKLSHHIKIF